MTHGAPDGSGDYGAVEYGAVSTLLTALDGREVPVVLMSSIGVTATGGASREMLEWKRRGERLLRASGLPYVIVRPGWFVARSGFEAQIDLRQGYRTEYGPVQDGPAITDWSEAFGATTTDSPGSLDGALDRPGPGWTRNPTQFGPTSATTVTTTDPGNHPNTDPHNTWSTRGVAPRSVLLIAVAVWGRPEASGGRASAVLSRFGIY